MASSQPKFNKKIAERLDNSVAICDLSFLKHKGFGNFAESYVGRPLNCCMVVPAGVVEDADRLIKAKLLPEVMQQELWDNLEVLIKLLDNGCAELNGRHTETNISVHQQIMELTDWFRTNHRICVLTNSSRILESVQNLRNDRRKQAKGISCIRLSDKTNKPMIARWYNPSTYATSYLG